MRARGEAALRIGGPLAGRSRLVRLGLRSRVEGAEEGVLNLRFSTLGALSALALAVPGLAKAEPKLAIGSIQGDASRVRRQILVQLCGPYDCVAASRVTTAARPDPEKLQRGGVAGYLGGAVTGEPGDRRLFLALTTPASTARKPARTWRFRLTPDGRLPPQVLERFSGELDEMFRGATARPSPAPGGPPQQQPPPPQAVRSQPAERPPEPVKPRAAEPARRETGAGERLRVAAEAGFWITGRKLSYSGAVPGALGSLRTYEATAIFVPSVRLELYPAAWVGVSSPAAGVGLYLDYGQSVGLDVKPPSGFAEGNHPGKLTALDVGVLWRFRPVPRSRFVLAPAAGYRSLSVVTSEKGGVKIPGLPDTRPSGFEVRLDAEIPATRPLTLLLGGGYTVWTSAKDLVDGDQFFGKGSARGWELQAGAAYRLFGPLSVKGMVEYQSTSYSSLEDPAAGIGTADSATDRYLGGRVMVRAEY